MGVNSSVLSGLIRRIDKHFNMESFDNRLRLQKIIYLLQAYGINLGYEYRLYLYGPYCTHLTKTAFMVDSFTKAKEVYLEDESLEKIFKEFLKRVESHKKDSNWLEIASTIHLFKTMHPLKNREGIIGEVIIMKPKFTQKEVNRIYQEIEEWQILN